MPDLKNLGAVPFQGGDRAYVERGSGGSAQMVQVVLKSLAVHDLPSGIEESAEGDVVLAIRDGQVIAVASAPGGGGYATLGELVDDAVEAAGDETLGPQLGDGLAGRIRDAFAALEGEDRLNSAAVAPDPGAVRLNLIIGHGLAVDDEVAYRVAEVTADYVLLEPILDQIGQLEWPVALTVLVEAPNPADPPLTEVYTIHQLRRAAGHWQAGADEIEANGTFTLNADLGANIVVGLTGDATLNGIDEAPDDGGMLVVYQKEDSNSPLTYDNTLSFDTGAFTVLTATDLNEGENAVTIFVWKRRPALNSGAVPAKILISKVG